MTTAEVDLDRRFELAAHGDMARPPAHSALYLAWSQLHLHSTSARTIIDSLHLADYEVAELLEAYLPYWYTPHDNYTFAYRERPVWAVDMDELRIIRKILTEVLATKTRTSDVTAEFAAVMSTLPPDVAFTLTQELFTPIVAYLPFVAHTDDPGLFTADLFNVVYESEGMSRERYLRHRLKSAQPALSKTETALATVLAKNWRGTLPELLCTARGLCE
jgi:hypothetical protein